MEDSAQKQTKKREAKKLYRRRNKLYIQRYLESHPCVDCGYGDILALQFDHVIGQKKSGVAKMKDHSFISIIEEIAKCEVRCANCHQVKTVTQKDYLGRLVT